nr:tRNA pseudouridine(54/55) synthase Pus10 [Candidatus Sigynarchaeota archaeon]
MDGEKSSGPVDIVGMVETLLANHELCDHCLGRQFAMLGTGIENGFRGAMLRNVAVMGAHASFKDVSETGNAKDADVFRAMIVGHARSGSIIATRLLDHLKGRAPAGVYGSQASPQDALESTRCILCNGIFHARNKDAFIEAAVAASKDIEFSSFLVGSRFPALLVEREEELRVHHGLRWGEAPKSHFNRHVGSILGDKLKKPVDFKEPDVVFVFNILKAPDAENKHFTLELLVNPYFIFGKYRKLVRGIPQTHWPHRECAGKGCEACGFTGKQYKESVEELMAGPVLEVAHASGIKFHGAGREDIDARMLGDGRPFTLEIINGKVRSIDFEKLQQIINQQAAGKIEVSGLRYSTKDEMQGLKEDSSTTRKRYKALCTLEKPIAEDALKTIKAQLESTAIKQRTPVRVAHRRADKIRVKTIHSFDWQRKETDPDGLEIFFFIDAEGGTYIKELISSDDGRTQPSISSIAGQQIRCKELDVLDVSHGRG